MTHWRFRCRSPGRPADSSAYAVRLGGVAFLAAWLLAFVPAGLYAAGSESTRKANDLQMSVDTRWAGGANGGYYPIRIRLTNLARPRALRFEFIDMGGSGAREPTVTRDVLIDQNATEHFTLPVPLVSGAPTDNCGSSRTGAISTRCRNMSRSPMRSRGGPTGPRSWSFLRIPRSIAQNSSRQWNRCRQPA